MVDYYDRLETRTADERATALLTALPRQIAHAKAHSPFFAEWLADVDPAMIRTADDLARLPVLRKADLVERQANNPPFGGMTAADALLRVFQSPGPINEPQGRTEDYWRFARAMFAAGFRAGGMIHNTFAYHFTPAGFMFDSAGAAMGCPVFPAGTGQTEQQVRAIERFRPRYYTGTPSFLNIILEKADELGADVSSLEAGLVTAEPLSPSLVASFGERGIDVYQCYGTADLGLIAYETEPRDGLVVDEGVIVEIVRPGSGDPVPEGEVGEVVVTIFNREYPLIRFATGDMSAVLPGECRTGRTNRRIRGWMGRADQTTKVRGIFVHPSQVNEIARRHPELKRTRLVVTQQDHRDMMTLHCVSDAAGDDLANRVGETIREVCKVRGEVAFVDELPNDGKVIDDQRTFE